MELGAQISNIFYRSILSWLPLSYKLLDDALGQGVRSHPQIF